jgi:hypothetical protein
MRSNEQDLTFISYSHKDKQWLDKLQTMLKPLVRQGSLVLWADTEIKAGEKWRAEIEKALASARVAVLLVSRDFLFSDFIDRHELPPLLEKGKAGGLTVLWVYINSCLYEKTDIAHYQAAHDISRPLDGLTESEQWKVMKEIAEKIEAATGKSAQAPAIATFSSVQTSAIKGLRPFKRDDAGVFTLLQRGRDLERCLAAIADPDFRFGILSGESGCGKSSFLQAGLWPGLEAYSTPHRCVYVKFANEDPFVSIQRALTAQLGCCEEELKESNFVSQLEAVAPLHSQPLVLIFDQFEQFFVHCKAKQNREPFVQGMAAWYHRTLSLHMKVLISVRGDFNDRLIELQQAMGYSIGPGQNFRLEKFEPREATEIMCVIAKQDDLPFDERFIETMAREELASREDGLVSPVDLQVLAWMIKGLKTEDKRGFTSKAFHKVGGVEGLLERFLTDTLAARHSEADKQAALKILLAMIDLERNARAGSMTLEQIKTRIAGTMASDAVEDLVRWLAREDIRLLTPIERDDTVEYELAHERLIAAVRKVAGKQLSKVDQANQILDQRVNEWLGNDRHPRYLLGWRDWRLVERNRPYLVWGRQRSHKEELLQKTRKRLVRYAWGSSGILALIVLFFAARLTPWGQIQLVKSELRALGKSTDVKTLVAITNGYVSIGDSEEARLVAERIVDTTHKSEALGAVVQAMAQVGAKTQSTDLLAQALRVTEGMTDSFPKGQALGAVAQAMVQVGEKTKSADLVTQALRVVESMPDSFKVQALGAVAQPMAQVEDTIRA